MKKIGLLVFGLAVAIFVNGQTIKVQKETSVPKLEQDSVNCQILRHAVLENEELHNQIIINGSKFMEFTPDGKYYIKAKLKWISECEYESIITKCTIPNFPFGKGDSMSVKINKIEDGIVYMTATAHLLNIPIDLTYKLIK